MRTTISLTSLDIELGCVIDSDNCPLALAFNRVLTVGHCARVGREAVEIVQVDKFDEGTSVVLIGNYPLPDRAQDFILAFDGEDRDYVPFSAGEREELIQPFEFEMELPAEVLIGEAVPA